MSIKRTELIDAYLRNELNSGETQAFESELAGDPSLQEELGFQQQVVKGLGEFRKAELKSRLTAINIATPWWEVGQIFNPALVKMGGAVLTAAFIGAGIYYFGGQEATNDISDTPTVFQEDLLGTEDQYPYALFEETRREAPEATAYLEEHAKDASQLAGNSEDSRADYLAVVKSDAASNSSTLAGNNEEELRDFVPEVALPNPGDGTERVQFKSESAEIPLASKTDIINDTEQIDIKTTQRNNEDVRYKYYEGKLHLYGNFKENPYEILEINSISSKQVYLFHNNRYYKLLTTDKILDLPQITDRMLIQELEIVRNNKVTDQ